MQGVFRQHQEEIEARAAQKIRAGEFEENGTVLIRTLDLNPYMPEAAANAAAPSLAAPADAGSQLSASRRNFRTGPGVDFSNADELRRFLEAQPRQVGIALAARAALRVLPMIGLPFGASLGNSESEAVVHSVFRAVAVAWTASAPYIRLTFQAEATSAAAIILQVGGSWINPAASAARRSAAEAVRAVASTSSDLVDALAAAVTTAFSAEAGGQDARGPAALADDFALLTGHGSLFLNNVPLWPKGTPAWADPRWYSLRNALLDAEHDWQVWTIWYQDRLDGRVQSLEREMAYVALPDELWEQASATINAEIIKRIEVVEPKPQPVAPPTEPIPDPAAVSGTDLIGAPQERPIEPQAIMGVGVSPPTTSNTPQGPETHQLEIPTIPIGEKIDVPDVAEAFARCPGESGRKLRRARSTWITAAGGRLRKAADLPDPTLVLRRANVSRIGGEWKHEDYDVFDGDRFVGRIYQADNYPGHESWFWGVDFQLTHHISYGYVPSLDEARAAFKAEYEKWKSGVR
jgi:hypothetical protein